MGSGSSRHLLTCFRSTDGATAGNHADFETGDTLDETLGHSFCYVSAPAVAGDASPRSSTSSAQASAATDVAFRSISGASVSANSSVPLPIYENATTTRRSHFRSSSSFSSIPIQLAGDGDRRFFLSGPIERGGALSGPLDSSNLQFSGLIAKKKKSRGISGRRMVKQASFLRRSLSEKNRPWVVPLRAFPRKKCDRNEEEINEEGVQWARGMAGEDRAHIVISESQKWLFVGIYDGFNGPEAPEFLVENLYRNVVGQLKGLFWEEVADEEEESLRIGRRLWEYLEEEEADERMEFSGSGRFAFSMARLRSGLGSWRKEEKSKMNLEVSGIGSNRKKRRAGPISDHGSVLNAIKRALEVTENAYLEMTDRAMECNPELAVMGSCLLVVLMREDDVYVMNLGDSRAIVAQYRGKIGGMEIDGPGHRETELVALQLSTDHSMSIEEEVLRIREEHPDDDQCIVNGRVKGRLNVTRAFGAGYLKHPKWNDALLEIFRNEYIGTAPYLSSLPSHCHYKLSANDQFLVLSSDGLYQYLSNEEVVLYVESFMERFPDGDPAQSLIEELLVRAAQKAGMGFSELLDIPHGDRRKYHDDVTVMVISLEGRIWKSSGRYA